jgi:thiamine pyrophosphate-dependent acetolactate synthase large subunit-like protein
MQSRLREEIARARRYNTPFTLVQFEAGHSDGVPMHQKMKYALGVVAASVRTSDVVALAFEDTIVALLVHTDAASAKDALQRIRSRVAQIGTWRLSVYVFPDDAELIEALPVLTAA